MGNAYTQSYDVLPDDDAWANSYILFKFPERPSAATALNPTSKASRARLDRSVLRPIVDDDQQLIDFFLPKDTDLARLSALEENPIDSATAETVRETPADDENIDEIFPNAAYERIRTYEVVSQLSVQDKEVLLTFSEEKVEDDKEDEDDMFGDDEHKPKKRKGAFFKPITMRSQLRKTRANRRAELDRTMLWDKMRVGFREPGEEEVQMRKDTSKQVVDSTWVEEQLGEETGDMFAETLREANADID